MVSKSLRWEIAGNARKELEQKSNEKVISKNNNLNNLKINN